MENKGEIQLLGKDYQVFENNEGFLELYRSVGNVKITTHGIHADRLERFVTNIKDKKDLGEWFRKRKRTPSYNPYKDINQLKLI